MGHVVGGMRTESEEIWFLRSVEEEGGEAGEREMQKMERACKDFCPA